MPWLVWVSWLEPHPIDQKVIGSIPHQGGYLGFRFNLCQGTYKKATNGCFSFTSLSLSLFLSISVSLSFSNEKKKKYPQVRIKEKE